MNTGRGDGIRGLANHPCPTAGPWLLALPKSAIDGPSEASMVFFTRLRGYGALGAGCDRWCLGRCIWVAREECLQIQRSTLRGGGDHVDVDIATSAYDTEPVDIEILCPCEHRIE